MMETLIIAAIVTLAGTLILSGLVLVFDRYAPARFVRERHDFGLAVFLTLPLLFALACLPSPVDVAGTPTQYQAVTMDRASPAAVHTLPVAGQADSADS